MMNEELYLIAHKLRGAPTFDIAIQMTMDDEVWWILPSTGHRAYPIIHWPLKELGIIDCPFSVSDEAGPLVFHPDWEGLPDFYPRNEPILDRKAEASVGRSLLESLGLAKDRPHPSVSGKIERRI